MRLKAFIIITFLFLNTLVFGQEAKKITIPEGTIVVVKSIADISSKTAREGDLLDFITAEDILIDGVVVIKENARVSANVEDAEHAKSLGKQGSLTIKFSNVKAANGVNIPLRAVRGSSEGKSTIGATVALSVVLSPLFLLKKGKEIKIPAGKLMEAYVSRDMELNITK
jgi:hypothetical protein